MRLTQGKTPTRIVDIAELYAPQWVTVDTIVMELHQRFGDEPTQQHVARSIHRLAATGHLQKRVGRFYDYDTGLERVHRPYGQAMGYMVRNRLEVTA